MLSVESSEPRRIALRPTALTPAAKRKCLPSGRNQGQRCVGSPGLSLPASLTAPPAAETLRRTPVVPGANATRPCELQLPPLALLVASASASTAPPLASIRFSLPFAKNPIDLPSGDQNG